MTRQLSHKLDVFSRTSALFVPTLRDLCMYCFAIGLSDENVARLEARLSLIEETSSLLVGTGNGM